MKSIFRKSLFGLVALLAFVGMFTPETLYAIGTCSSLPPSGIFPEIDIAVAGYGTFSNSSPTNPDTSYNISVPSGTSLSIHVDTFAEPSTRNSMSYPGGSEIIYSGPSGRMGGGRDYTSGVITGSSQIYVSVGPNNCTPITDGETSSVTVNVTVAPTYTLTASKAGTGAGTITSSPAGINYGADNSEAYASGTSVTLSQVAAGGSTFAGWSGACSGTGACVVSMTQARSVTATFNATGYTLTASKAGTGTGTITSSPAGINCGADCSEVYASGTSVGLTATPTGGSTFAGWSGSPDCSNDAGGAMANPTSVMMNAAKSCTATFDLAVVQAPSCSASPSTVAVGQNVTITASGGSGGTSPFYTWSTGSGGGSCVSGGTCTTSYSSSGTKTVTVTRNGVQGTCIVNVSTDTPPTGALTSTASCTATGWADDADTTVPRSVRIYSDGNLVSTVTAGTTGCTGSACTFSANLTGLISTGVAHNITGTVQGNDNVWYALSNPMSMTCPVAPTPPTAAFTGSSACTVSGWGDDVNTTVARPIRIYSDGNLVSTVTAGTTGCTGSACTFSANLTGLISTGVAHNITGTVQGNDNVWYALSNPMSMTCAATPAVSCSGVSAGQTGTSYTFTGSGGSTYTWAVSPTTGLTPAGATGTGGTVTKSFSSAGAKTISFTSGAQTGTCNVTISASAPALGADLMINGSNGPITIAYGSLPTLTWSSSGAFRCDSPAGATPADTDWPSSGDVGLSGTQSVSPLVRTTYPLRCVNAVPQTVTDSVVARITPECLPAGQTVTVGQNATLTARGGDGTYAWTATGGTTASGSGSSFTTSYATEGTKTVSLTSDSLTATACTVTVSAAPATTGTIIVNSNVATTWSLSGPSDLSVGKTPQTTVTYTDLAAGTYTLSAEALAGYQAPVITPASSQALAAGETKTFTITYTALAAGNIDLEINNSDGPVQIVEGASGLLTWTSSNIKAGSCVASGGWSGAQDDEESEGVSTGAINDDTTFTITCDTSSGGTVSDDVDVTTRLPECRDGINNDTEDTRIDFAGNDLGCTNADDDDETNGVPECSDGIDNSDAEDTIIDYPDDPGCLTANDDNEDDIEITECSDGFDNDGDGGVDDADAECTDPTDTSERATPDIREI